jgi:oligoribonuclease NrnB/cAMP/cGMP phosphodiesterase (DHH superfamily)
MNDWLRRVIWIDHHKSSIESHPTTIQGYRIDGVAACRLAWQYFAASMGGEEMNDARFLGWPKKEDFIDRKVSEPYAVQLAGEYDIWDKRNPHAEAFQFGLRSRELTEAIWRDMFVLDNGLNKPRIVHDLIESGLLLQTYQQKNDEGIMHRSFMVNFEGLKFLALNTARLNSLTFASKDTPETGHDALMGFYWNGDVWNVSLYHAKHRTDIDLSQIAVKHGGGGHRGACGMKMKQLLDFM